MCPRVAGVGHLGIGPERVDFPAADVGVFAGQQAFHRHVDEIRVAIVGVAVGEGQLQRLQHRVDVLCRVVAHALEVAAFQDAQGVQIHRPLAPRAAGVNVDALVVNHRRNIHADGETGQVVHGEPAALAADEGHHLLGDLARVEQVPGRLQAALATLTGGSAFDVDHPLECAGQVGLHQQVANLQGLAARIENLHGAGPLAGVAFVQDDAVAAADQRPMQRGRNGESAGGQFQGWRNHLLEGHGAVPAQRRNPGIGSGGRNRPHDTVGHIPAVFSHEVVDAGLGRPPAQTADLAGFPRRGVVDDDWSHAAKTGVLGQRYVDDNAGRHARVNRVAALLQDTVAGRRRQIVAGADHVRGAAHQGSITVDSNSHNALHIGFATRARTRAIHKPQIMPQYNRPQPYCHCA